MSFSFDPAANTSSPRRLLDGMFHRIADAFTTSEEIFHQQRANKHATPGMESPNVRASRSRIVRSFLSEAGCSTSPVRATSPQTRGAYREVREQGKEATWMGDFVSKRLRA